MSHSKSFHRKHPVEIFLKNFSIKVCSPKMSIGFATSCTKNSRIPGSLPSLDFLTCFDYSEYVSLNNVKSEQFLTI